MDLVHRVLSTEFDILATARDHKPGFVFLAAVRESQDLAYTEPVRRK
jgi:hypothetical protein